MFGFAGGVEIHHEGTKGHEVFYHKEHKVFHKGHKGGLFFVNFVRHFVPFVVKK